MRCQLDRALYFLPNENTRDGEKHILSTWTGATKTRQKCTIQLAIQSPSLGLSSRRKYKARSTCRSGIRLFKKNVWMYETVSHPHIEAVVVGIQVRPICREVVPYDDNSARLQQCRKPFPESSVEHPECETNLIMVEIKLNIFWILCQEWGIQICHEMCC